MYVRMASTGFLFRLSRSSASRASLSSCLPAIGKHAGDLHTQNRFQSNTSSASADDENASDSATSRSPILEAHLASLETQPVQPNQKSRGGAEEADEVITEGTDAALRTISGEETQESKPGVRARNRPQPVQRLVFDEETAAKVSDGDEYVQPWSQEREAQVAQAVENIEQRKSSRAAKRATGDAADTVEEEATPSFLEPRKLEDLPEELKPRFRLIERKRPVPTRVAQVWEMLRSSDRMGKRAKKNGFVPSVDCSISLFIDPRRSDQLVRGTVSLPHGTGKDTKVAVFTSREGDRAAAEAAGAAIIGGEDLVAKVAESKSIAADAVIATPDMVPKLGKIARILGPRGLMPNPKFGTVTTRVADTVEELRRGKVQFRNDKGGTLSASIGRKTFSDSQLTDNFFAFVQAVMSLRPKGLPGNDITGYVERVSVSTTQGKGLPVSFEDLNITAREEYIRRSAV